MNNTMTDLVFETKESSLFEKLQKVGLTLSNDEFYVNYNFKQLLEAMGPFVHGDFIVSEEENKILVEYFTKNVPCLYLYEQHRVVCTETGEEVFDDEDENDDDEDTKSAYFPLKLQHVESRVPSYGLYVTDNELFYIDNTTIRYVRKVGTEPSEYYKFCEEAYVRYLNTPKLRPTVHNNLYLFAKTMNGYETFRMPSRKKVVLQDREIFYPGVNHQKLVHFMENSNPDGGKILLLYGAPGTGKTTYIRDLMSNYGSNNILMFTADMVEHFSSPAFIASLMTNYANSIILIEDAENLIMSRENGNDKNNLISDFLNLTDGIFGDSANIRVMLTFNTELKNIDKAILRKGRLYFMQQFPKLTKDEANRALEKLGKEAKATGEMSLAEIYNIDEVYE